MDDDSPTVGSLARTVGAALVAGLLAGGFAIGFRVAIQAGMAVFLGDPNVLDAFTGLGPTERVLAPAIGGLAAGALVTALVRRGGHRMADVMEAVALGRGHVSVRMVLAKAAASYTALVGGGSIGREGSILLFGAAMGGAVGDRLQIGERDRRALVAAGTAAGFAAAYNTPIAGIVFVIEVITGIAALEVLLPVILATVAATTLSRAVTGAVPLYGMRSFVLVSDREYAAYALLGTFAGLLGAAFMALLFAAEQEVDRRFRGRPRWVVGAIGGLGVGAVAVTAPEVAGNGFEAIQRMLDGRIAGLALVALLYAKGLATVSSVASGSPGGVFTPSMFLGAALGGAIGFVAPLVLPEAGPPGGYALVGMAAMLAATTHAPLMAATLAFELSGDYGIVLPLLVATGLSAFVSRAVHPDSVYTEELRRRGIQWHGSLARRLARTVRASDILVRGVPVVAADTPIAQVLALVDAGARAVYVARPWRVISADAVRQIWEMQALGEPIPATAAGAARPIEAVPGQTDLLALSERVWRSGEPEIPVVDDGDPDALLGVVTARDLLGALDREVLDREVLSTRVLRYEGEGSSADFLELPSGWVVETVRAPDAWVGQPIDRAGKVLVVGRRPGGRGALQPPDGAPVAAGDELVVVGDAADVAAVLTRR